MAIARNVKGNTLYLTEGDRTVLTMSEELQDDQVMIKLTGSLRSDTQHDLQDELVALTTMGLKLTLELSGVDYISAACQQVLLSVQQKIDELGRGDLQLTKLNSRLREEFEQTGLSELLLIID